MRDRRKEGSAGEESRGAGCNGPRRPHGSTAAAALSDGAFATVDYGDERRNKTTSAAKAALDAARRPRLGASVRERSDQAVLSERVGIASSDDDVIKAADFDERKRFLDARGDELVCAGWILDAARV